MVEVKKVECMGWKDCILLTNGVVEVIATTQVGPRIISYRVNGGANHMAVLEADKGKTGGEEFRGYGGHRVWHAPEENPRSYFPDNTDCDYEIFENGAQIMHFEEETGLTKGMILHLYEDGTLKVINLIVNEGHFPVSLSVWGLTQFDAGGLMAVPNTVLDTGLVSNRAVSMWPYSRMNDSRVYWGDQFVTVKADREATSPFKFGATVDEGYAAYFNHNQLVVKEFGPRQNSETEHFPNYECNFESYTNDKFIEIETLTPIISIDPLEYEASMEYWVCAENVALPKYNNEKAIKRAVDSLRKKINHKKYAKETVKTTDF